ncbi:uncharacterized protein J4E84_001606 [Alternaria hordeiaustralica]|uniref:uncharacterized protein n=1 Tax=Alternaria hordeiaustralica TaxID=1187925 RepID=UPI0020C284C2|nr:uncharacterized protein J4E84_001606 [Alternaria hordeiaustralica]KAI4694982.1 hypothetical protein J4E84_001606 [Alternaria hordeiaustralica]
MDPQQQYIAQVKEEYDELGIWVPVNEEPEPAEGVSAAVLKVEPTDQSQTTTTHNKPKKAKKAKKIKRTEPLTKRERHVQRLETLNSQLRKDLREARDGTTVQLMKDLESQVLLLQEAIGSNKASIIKDLKLENLQLQKKVENLQREVKNAERDVRAHNNSIEDREEKVVLKGRGHKLAQAKAQSDLAVRNLKRKLKSEHKARKRVEDRWRLAEARLARLTGLEGDGAEVTEELLNEEESMEEDVIKDEDLMESEW